MSSTPRAAALLIAPPWNMPDVTSIQVGCLKAFVNQTGHTAVARHYYKDIVDYVGAQQVQVVLDAGVGEHLFGTFLFPDRRDAIADTIRKRVPDDFDIEACEAGLAAFLDEATADIEAAFEVTPFDVVGFTTTHVQLTASLCLAARLRTRRPGAHVVLGGLSLHGELAENLVDLFPAIDSVIVGEGERALVRLLDVIADGGRLEAVPQLVHRTDDGVRTNPEVDTIADLETAPPPDYEEFFDRALRPSGVKPYPRLCVETARGCRWGKCSFCIEGLDSRGGYRIKSPPKVAAEIAELARRHRTLDVIFSDPDLATRSAVFEALAAEPATFRLAAEVSGLVTRPTLVTMRDAGLRVIQIGIESFSPRLLAEFEKGVPLIHYVELMKWTRELGITLVYNVIVGAPFEQQDDVDLAVANMASLLPFQPPIVSHFVVSVGSRILDAPASYNIAEIWPADETSCYPDEVRRRIAPLLSFHAGYGFTPADERAVDRTAYRDLIDEWWRVHEVGASLIGGVGDGFVDVEIRIGEHARHVIVDDPVEIDLLLFCASRARTDAEVARAFAHHAPEAIDHAVARLRSVHLLFRESGRCLSLPSFPETALEPYERLGRRERVPLQVRPSGP